MVKKPTESSNLGKVQEMISEHTVEYVDLRFTDPRGKWQHTAQHVSTMDEDAFRDGIMFDGSSIAGWKAINESDMILMPDPDTAVMDPFSAKPSMILFCDIIEPSTGQGYSPRSAQHVEKGRGLCEVVRHRRRGVSSGPEAEFFIFDSVKYGTGGNYGMYQLDSQEGPQSSMKDYPEGNMGHRPRSRAAISRCLRWTPTAICARKCCRPWARWAWRSRSTIMKSRRASTNSG